MNQAERNTSLFSNLSLKQRIIIPILGVSAIILIALTWLSTSRMRNITEAQALHNVREMASGYSRQVRLELESPINMVRSQALMLKGMRQLGPISRASFSSGIKAMLEKNMNLVGIWTA